MGLGRGSEGQMPEKKFVPGVVPGQDVPAASQHHGRNGLVQRLEECQHSAVKHFREFAAHWG